MRCILYRPNNNTIVRSAMSGNRKMERARLCCCCCLRPNGLVIVVVYLSRRCAAMMSRGRGIKRLLDRCRGHQQQQVVMTRVDCPTLGLRPPWNRRRKRGEEEGLLPMMLGHRLSVLDACDEKETVSHDDDDDVRHSFFFLSLFLLTSTFFFYCCCFTLLLLLLLLASTQQQHTGLHVLLLRLFREKRNRVAAAAGRIAMPCCCVHVVRCTCLSVQLLTGNRQQQQQTI